MRLDKLICQESLETRTQAQKMIRGGRVTVNGGPATDPGLHVDPERDAVAWDGKRILPAGEKHLMLYKPAGILTAARDRAQRTGMDLLPPCYCARGCMPVGRLDKDVTGLLLFTTDGELSHRLLSPKRHVEKEYLAWVEGKLWDGDREAFLQGIPLSDFICQPARLEIVQSAEEKSLGRVFLREGKFHQVKRMFAARNHPVLSLHREAFGPLRLDGGLEEGGFRELTQEEVQALYRCAGMTP